MIWKTTDLDQHLYGFAVQKFRKTDAKAAFRLFERLATCARGVGGVAAEVLIWDLYTHKAGEEAAPASARRKAAAARKLK